ncbi:helix-turn-helix domain-containing protein [Hymenobacter sp. AT01-02]|uniref:helix-turn-helix domain-containing protein n=1 Tax=Hymenobacter sp. AT01-02 TaxID=1571877 RepID=UPI0005F1F178|nr:helix-turn-helix domain-containing protein [Hymenobacter sp. AT01-02]
MNHFPITARSVVSYEGRQYHVKALLDMRRLLLERMEDDHIVVAAVDDVLPVYANDAKTPSFELATDEQWATANNRFALLKPILDKRTDGALIKQVAREHKVSPSTLYRWLERYEATGLVASLMDKPRNGGRGKPRLAPEIDAIVQQAIKEEYLTEQRKPLAKVHQRVVSQCRRAGLQVPHPNTIRNRIRQLTEYNRLRYRYGKAVADDQLAPHKGSFPGADFPLAFVQIDHTKLDIELVDEIQRLPVGRPWITMAIDVFSRMVVGFYVSFDPPGAMGTGMCIANAILPKEQILALHDLGGEWPCWGVMRTLHLDNAREFHGTMLKRACEQYGIELNWRPVATPRYGGHIERYLGTVLEEIHTLPGTTFSSVAERGDYESEEKAALTLRELEKWLLTFITDVYHKREHSSLGMAPLERYKQGVFGTDTTSGSGLPFRFMSEEKVRLDFMPFEERTVQEYGVLIDHIYYYHDVLRRWIKTTDKYKRRQKLLFKRDPRDVSIVYFYDPELEQYFAIPYRDTSRPPMSIWEHREAVRRVRAQNIPVDEEHIFAAYEAMRHIEEQAVKQTKEVRRRNQRQPVHASRLAFLATEKEPVTQESLPAVQPRHYTPFGDL